MTSNNSTGATSLRSAGLTAIFRLIWSQFSLFLVIGSALIYLGEYWRLSWAATQGNDHHTSNPFLHAVPLLVGHIGVAVVVATLVGILFHMREFSEFFLSLAKSTLIEDGYLEKLKPESLLQLRARAGSVIIGATVDNEKYDRRHLERLIDEVLFKKLLPTENSHDGIYRQNVSEIITLKIMTLQEALAECKVSVGSLSANELAAPIIKCTELTEYELVAPRKAVLLSKEFSVPLLGNSTAIKGFPKEKRVSYQVGTSRESSKPVDVETTEKDGAFQFTATGSVTFKDNITTIWCRRVEYRSPNNEPFMLKLMSRLTRNIDVRVNVLGGPPLSFSGGVFGLASTVPDPEMTEDGIRLKYDGWMLEDHGYYVWWWNREERSVP